MSEKKLTLAENLAAQGYTVKPCKGCGKPMVWATKEDGVWIPLDPVSPVYTAVIIEDFQGRTHPKAIRNMLSFVSHFVTCPKREEFSGKKAANTP